VERSGELSLNQTAILGLLVRGGAMTPGEIAERMHSRPQSLTRAFAVIEERGWVSRTPDIRDGRQSLLSITAAGRAALTAEMRPRDVWLARVVAQELTEAERDLLVIAGRLMERLAYIDTSPAPIEQQP
jgi:DNA-binding MarR family transcriptional regulator